MSAKKKPPAPKKRTTPKQKKATPSKAATSKATPPRPKPASKKRAAAPRKATAPTRQPRAARPSRALVELYEGLHTKVFETVFNRDAALIEAFLAWGKATHPRWYAEIEGRRRSPAFRAVLLETLIADELDEAALVAFFESLPAGARRAAVAAMRAAEDVDDGDGADDDRASSPGAVTIADVTWVPGDTTLSLSGRGFTQLPDDIGRCTSVTELILGSNQLTSLPAAIGNLTELNSLDLQCNPLARLPPELARCTKLRKLVLFECTQLVLPALPALETVNAQATSLALLRSLAASPSVEWLNAMSCGLTAVPDELRALTNLQTLDLSDNKLETLPRWLAELRLTAVHVAGNPLPASELAWLKGILK